MGLISDRLIVDQHAIGDEVPALGLDALVVVPDRAQRSLLHLVGEQGDLVAAVLEVARFPFVQSGEAGAGIVGLVTQHAIEFGRMTNRFVDGQPQVRRIEHEIELAWLDRARGQLLPGLFRCGNGILEHVVGIRVADRAAGQLDTVLFLRIEIFIAHSDRRGKTVAATEFSARLVDRGHRKRRPDTVDVLIDIGLIG